jgi:hypothetical protein
MNITKMGRALAISAIAGAFITQAADASADVLCRAVWPAVITQCQSNVTVFGESATGSGRTTSTTLRVTANLVAGFTSAQAAALDSQGHIIPGCSVTDAAPVDSQSKSVDCTGIPATFFITAH